MLERCMNSKYGKPVTILLVEDNEADAVLTREAFSEARIPSEFHTVEDGIEALSFLRRQHKYSAAPRPDLILLDLNLPRKDGRAALKEIKSDPTLAAIPVVILSTSAAVEDVNHAYASHANCYITKPVDFGQFIEVVRTIESFWLTVARLPDLA
jgi:chemotaxis family two-component system response regulator Rcp1